ncbi:MAG: extracellular solute-binding protein [Erysipelotrichaceae bacterium]|nr:extracellular solute-binding protein [Erysipelotrichaceae bacterium]MBQ3412443.1 extracellular solute-binding protein [Oscillospiraceae bacterium]
MKKLLSIMLIISLCMVMLTGCGAKEEEKKRETIVIYSAANTKRLENMQTVLSEKFPDYDFVVEYLGTSKLAAKLMAEGTDTDIDIIHDLSYTNMNKLSEVGYLADLSWVDYSIYYPECNPASKDYVIECRVSGAVALNTKLFEEKGLTEPTSWDDLLKPEFKGLVSMSDPKSSSAGYMFVKMLANTWGEDKALEYFGKLMDNIPQLQSGGNGPCNALISEEAAVGLVMTTNAAEAITNGDPLKIMFFEEGAPVAYYGQSMVKGKDERACVKEVFEYLIKDFRIEELKLWPSEPTIINAPVNLENVPEVIPFGDMSNDTLDAKEALLAKWLYS